MIFHKTNRVQKDAQTPGLVMTSGRRGWVAGVRWVQSGTAVGLLSRLRMTDSHFLSPGTGKDHLTGCVTVGKHHRGLALYSLAVAFLESIGGSSYGIYYLDDGMWIFLATLRGRLSVMGDVTGTLNEVCAARDQFLSFNDPGNAGWDHIVGPEDATDWRTLTERLPRKSLMRCRLRPASYRHVALGLCGVILLGVACIALQGEAEKARSAAVQAAMKATSAIVKPVSPVRIPHPWAMQTAVPVFLRACRDARGALPVSVAGCRLTAGGCDDDGLRLHYEVTQGCNVEDFDVRARVLSGHPASFNLDDGGRSGEIMVPFSATAAMLHDEPLPAKDIQLRRFIAALQRRNTPVHITELKPAENLPGSRPEQAPLTWSQYDFSFRTRLPPERLLDGIIDSGLRLMSIGFTLDTQGKFDYTVRGSLYAQK
ncbi:MAG TPA: type 4b pilus protein PilO2 [Scandinavium sp.]|jgi:hypothetical protein